MKKLKLYLVCIVISLSTLLGSFILEISSEASATMYIIGLMACAYCFVPPIIWMEKSSNRANKKHRRCRELKRQKEVA